jgi:hypothetical protein
MRQRTITITLAPARRAVWAVYGPDGKGRVSARLAEYPHNRRADADAHSTRVPKSWVMLEKVEIL